MNKGTEGVERGLKGRIGVAVKVVWCAEGEKMGLRGEYKEGEERW